MALDSNEQILARLVRAALIDPSTPLAEFSDALNFDWQGVVKAAQRHRLEALLYSVIQKQNWRERISPNALRELQLANTRINVTNMLAFRGVENILARFASENIPLVLLKGCALAESLYQDIGLRPLSDIDILVLDHSVSRVSSLLIQQGYEPSPEPAEGFRESFEHERSFVPIKPSSVAVDVHWHLIHVRHYYERIPVDWFWKRTMEIRIGDIPALILAPEAQLLHLLLHYFFPHKSEGLLWSHDIALLLMRYRESFKWAQVFEAVQAFNLGHVFRSVITEVELVWDIRLSENVHQTLEKLRPSITERVLATAYTAEYIDAQTFFDILSVSSIRTKLVYFWRILFPSRVYMQTRYRIEHTYLLPLFYVARIGKGTFMFLRSVVSIGARLASSVWRSGVVDKSND